MTKHNVFISYHHANDQWAKEELLKFNDTHNIFIDGSVDTGDIDENLTDERIRTKIRDEYLKSTTVTILLVGEETKKRKHVDWELYSSMYDGAVNKKSGILVVNLPSTNCAYHDASHANEKDQIYPNSTWTTVSTRAEYERRYPYMPSRIIDNLLNTSARISVTSWDKVLNSPNLTLLIDNAYSSRVNNQYDLSAPMRRSNS